VSSQQELDDLRGIVTNLGGELTTQAGMYRMLEGRYRRIRGVEPNDEPTNDEYDECELANGSRFSIATSF